MKKTAALFAALCIAVSCSGCAKKTNAENSAAQTQNLNETGFSYTGSWIAKNVKIKNNRDGSIEAVAAGVLKNYFTKDCVMIINEDGSAQIDGKEVELKEEDGKMYITWDGSKTFMFDVEKTDDGFKLMYGKYLSVTFGK